MAAQRKWLSHPFLGLRKKIIYLIRSISLRFPATYLCASHGRKELEQAAINMSETMLLKFLSRVYRVFVCVEKIHFLLFSFSGPRPGQWGREHPREAREEDLRPDGQEPRRQAHARGVQGGQQGRPAHRAGALAGAGHHRDRVIGATAAASLPRIAAAGLRGGWQRSARRSGRTEFAEPSSLPPRRPFFTFSGRNAISGRLRDARFASRR